MEIQKGVTMLSASPHSHVYFIQGAENLLIDTGMPGAGKHILQELASMGVEPKSIKKILITHHDIDHIGNAKMLSEATDAEIWAPEEDIPYITGEKKRPGIKRMINAISRPKIPAHILPYAPGQQFGELKVIPAPGHTPGHVIFYYNKIIFAGDLFGIKGGVPEPMSGRMNADNNQAFASISQLKTLDIDWICPAHGRPASVNEAIRSFIEQH